MYSDRWNINKIEVLGLPCPAFYIKNLKEFLTGPEKNHATQKAMLDYTVWHSCQT